MQHCCSAGQPAVGWTCCSPPPLLTLSTSTYCAGVHVGRDGTFQLMYSALSWASRSENTQNLCMWGTAGAAGRGTKASRVSRSIESGWVDHRTMSVAGCYPLLPAIKLAHVITQKIATVTHLLQQTCP